MLVRDEFVLLIEMKCYMILDNDYRGQFADFSTTELSSLQYVTEGFAIIDGEELHYYKITIPRGTFETLGDGVPPLDVSYTNAERWEVWIRMIQITVHDLLALLPFEKVVLDIEIEDWLGLRNCIGVVKTRDHDYCDVEFEREDCNHIYEIMIPPSITNIPAINVTL